MLFFKIPTIIWYKFDDGGREVEVEVEVERKTGCGEPNTVYKLPI
jgi:hypothetical protein